MRVSTQLSKFRSALKEQTTLKRDIWADKARKLATGISAATDMICSPVRRFFDKEYGYQHGRLNSNPDFSLQALSEDKPTEQSLRVLIVPVYL